MKAMKKVLAFVLALAMVVTAVPVTDAAAKTVKLSAGTTKSKTFYTGKTHTLKLNGVTKADVKKTTWSSSNAKVVKVVADSQTKVSAKIKCVKKGTATVTAKVALKNGNTKTYKAKITVKAPTLTVSPSEMTLTVGETKAITAKKTPSGATLKYSSSDPGVATVSGKKITAKSAGKAVITVQLVNGTKKITKKIDVTVSAAKDGLTVLSLANSISDDYPNTVWVNEQAAIQIQYVKDGKPVSGETIVLANKSTTSFGANASKLNFTYTAVTDANGIATFVVGFTSPTIKATDTSYVGTFDYKVSVASNPTVTGEGQVAFAAIDLGTVRNVNRLAGWQRPAGIGELVVSTNDDGGDGYTTTSATATMQVKNNGVIVGADVDYVDSQQVSTVGTTEHQVMFDNFLPYIKMPNSGTDLSSATTFYQDVNLSSGSYSVYADSSQKIKLKVNPSELTYARLNFSKIQLSEHTKLVIECYKSEGGANGGYDLIRSEEINGEKDMLANGYPIPLNENYEEMVIKLTLKSAGQVNTDKNAGYEVKDITGVYKTTSNGSYTNVPLKGATVEWKTTTAVLSNVRELTAKEKELILDTSGIDLAATYAKVTYQVPVFPYTGNAILTCYDSNGKIKAYYACPTVNGSTLLRYNTAFGKRVGNAFTAVTTNIYAPEINKNVLDIYTLVSMSNGSVDHLPNGDIVVLRVPAAKCYKVSYEEAFNQVGDILPSDSGKVIVNSEKVGVTTLEGTVTLGGTSIAALDATNDTLYTSVQWCPVPQTVRKKAEAALIGQKVDVIAQLIDKNGNPVAAKDVGVVFHVDGNGSGINGLNTGTAAAGTTFGRYGLVTLVSAETTTDVNGQVKMTIKSDSMVASGEIYAKSASGQYDVRLSFSNGDTPSSAWVYWFDPDLKFTDTVVGTAKEARTTYHDPFKTTAEEGITLNPHTGENWDYGVQVIADKDGWEDPSEFYHVAVTGVTNGLTVDMSKSAASKGTVSFKNGVASATSKEAGETNITATLDADSVGAEVKFGMWSTVTNSWFEVKGVGYGVASISKSLTMNVVWQTSGITLTPLEINGTCAATTSGGAIIKTLYVKVTDKNGNPIDSENVTFTLGADWGTGGFVSDATVTPNDKGIASVTVQMPLAAVSVSNSRKTTTLTASIGTGVDKQTVAMMIRWVPNPDPFGVDVTSKLDDGSWATSIKDGKVVLTFSNSIDARSVVAEMFDVSIRDKKYEVTGFTVKGNSITLTVKNLPTDLAADEDVSVTIKHHTTDEGIEYILTSADGLELAADTVVKVYDSKITQPVLE